MIDSTRRTAGCGPACPVVWQGCAGNRVPYAYLRVGTRAALFADRPESLGSTVQRVHSCCSSAAAY